MTNKDPHAQERIKQYFRVKTRQLSTIADLPVCEHPVLIGSHREEIQRIFLREILPKRFEVGRGMVYGLTHRSKEADIVIWDAQNYPSLPMLDHSFFFADSVRAVLECKSRWSDSEFRDVMEKCCAVRDILKVAGPSLADEVAILKDEIRALKEGKQSIGMLITHHYISTAAIFITGGQNFSADFIDPELNSQIDDCWPDIMLLLAPGKVVIKNYQASTSGSFGGTGRLEFYDLGEDALLVFTSTLLKLVTERSVQVEDPIQLYKYAPEMVSIDSVANIDFTLRRPIPQRTPLWRTNSAPQATEEEDTI